VIEMELARPTQQPDSTDGVNWKSRVLIVLCLLLSAYSIGLLYEGYVSDRYSNFFTYPFVDKAAAERAFQHLPDGASVAEREVAARRLIEADPANPDSWNAVAHVAWLGGGETLTPQALAALDHSYAVSFHDRDGGVWRVGLALDNWPSLPPALRKDVLAEASVILRDPVLWPELAARLGQVKGPSGRLAALLILARARADRSAGG
jgi:hypothetical protein